MERERETEKEKKSDDNEEKMLHMDSDVAIDSQENVFQGIPSMSRLREEKH